MTITLTPETKHINVRDAERRWFLIDADGMVLGRLSALACHLLRGKWKPTYSEHMDAGDCVVVINAGKIKLTGQKLTQKIDFRASRRPGGQTYLQYMKLVNEKPDRVIELAVRGMLPKNRLRDRFMRRLKVFRGDDGAVKYPYAQKVDLTQTLTRSGGPYSPPPKPVKAAKVKQEA